MQNYMLSGIAFIAAIMDFVSFRVKNWLVAAGILLGIVVQICQGGLSGLLASLAGIVLPIICLGVFFLFHLFGAGDIKLFCAIGSFIGPEKIIYCMGAAILIGGVFGAVKLLLYDRDTEKVTIRFAIPIFLSVLLYQGGAY